MTDLRLDEAMSIASSNFIADGPFFRVNTHTEGDQRLSQVTALNNGTFYVIWTSTDQDGDRYGVFGQLFDADGNPIGPETQINTFTGLDQTLPQVTAYGDGNFVVVWQSFAQDETVYESYPDGLSPTGYQLSESAFVMQYGVFGQRFDSTGQPIGDEFQVNTTVRDNQINAEVITLPDGGFIVVWLNYFAHITYLGEPYGSHRFQRYDTDGNPVGGEVILDTYPPETDNYARFEGVYPEFTVTNDGTLVATWISPSTDYNYGLYMQEYDLDGTPLIDQQPVIPLSNMTITNSSITALDDGGYAISIVHHIDSLSGSPSAVFVRIFDVNGIPRGDEFFVSDDTMLDTTISKIVALPGGGFIVAWVDDGIRAQIFDNTGAEVGPEVLLSNETFGVYDFDITVLADGRLLLTSNGFDPTLGVGPDNPNDVIGQIFEITGFGITSLFSDLSDTVTLSDVENNVSALDGDDIITGGSLDDIIRGQNGNDTIHGEGGEDRIFGGDGNDTLSGGIGADGIGGGSGDDIIDGGIGDDRLYGDEGNDQIHGGDGDDYIEGGLGTNTLYGDSGDDVLIARASLDTHFNPSTVYSVNTLYGGDGNDYLRGHYGDDFLYGGADDDNLFGGFGNDHIDGGAGNDVISGGNGVDMLIGGDGNDTIYVGFDGSTVLAGAGNDTVYVTPSYSGVVGQIIDGGTGINTLAFANSSGAASIVTVDMSQSFIAFRTEYGYLDSFEQGFTNFTNIVVTGNYLAIIIGDDNANRIINAGTHWRDVPGGDGAVELVGGTVAAGGGDDYVEGSAGIDTLFGDAGNDTIFGGAGDDIIAGNGGTNILSGGSGADEFIFNNLEAVDTISDFEVGIDTINLSALFSQTETVSVHLNDMVFNRIRCFTDYDIDTMSVRFVQNGNNTEVYLEYKGVYSSSADAEPLIILQGVDSTTLSLDDFIF